MLPLTAWAAALLPERDVRHFGHRPAELLAVLLHLEHARRRDFLLEDQPAGILGRPDDLADRLVAHPLEDHARTGARGIVVLLAGGAGLYGGFIYRRQLAAVRSLVAGRGA